MRRLADVVIVFIIGAGLSACGGSGVAPTPGALPVPVNPPSNSTSGVSLPPPSSVTFNEVTSPATPLGGITLTPDGTVYLNASGDILQYNGAFHQFPYSLTFTDFIAGTITLVPGSGGRSLASESDGTVLTWVNGTYVVPPVGFVAGIVSFKSGTVTSKPTDFGPGGFAYTFVVAGPYGSVLAGTFLGGAKPEELSVFAPPTAPPITVGDFKDFRDIVTAAQGSDGMTYIAANSNVPGENQVILRMDPTTGTFVSTTVLNLASSIYEMTPGPDGAVWFTDRGTGKIGRVTSKGIVTYFAVPSGTLGSITTASDNALWFVDGNDIDRISTGGTVTSYPVPSADGAIGDLASGPLGSCIPGKIFFADAKGLGILNFSS